MLLVPLSGSGVFYGLNLDFGRLKLVFEIKRNELYD